VNLHQVATLQRHDAYAEPQTDGQQMTTPLFLTDRRAHSIDGSCNNYFIVGISVAAAAAAAAAAACRNTTRSKIKNADVGQQVGDGACTNQVQGQGGQQDDVLYTEQTTTADQGDPIPRLDVNRETSWWKWSGSRSK
jgi:hypothetical protein